MNENRLERALAREILKFGTSKGYLTPISVAGYRAMNLEICCREHIPLTYYKLAKAIISTCEVLSGNPN